MTHKKAQQAILSAKNTLEIIVERSVRRRREISAHAQCACAGVECVRRRRVRAQCVLMIGLRLHKANSLYVVSCFTLMYSTVYRIDKNQELFRMRKSIMLQPFGHSSGIRLWTVAD